VENFTGDFRDFSTADGIMAVELHLLLGSVTGNFGNLPDYGVDRCDGRVINRPRATIFL
jgi:hypothetical protein